MTTLGWHFSTNGRRANVLKKLKGFQEARNEPPLLELTEFNDKRDIVKKLFGLPDRFRRDLEEVCHLRDKIAHAASYSSTNADLQAFLRRMGLARTWTNKLQARLTSPEGNGQAR